MATVLEKTSPSPEAGTRPTREQCIQEAGAVLAPGTGVVRASIGSPGGSSMSTTSRSAEPQYFKQNQALLPAGPARIAEVAAAKKRHLAYQKAVSASREMKDAVMVGQPMDKTGNFDGALDHALQVLDRLNEAMAEYRIQGITFLAEFDTEDAA